MGKISSHGVEYRDHTGIDVAKYYLDYTETLGGVDESVGRLLNAWKARGELDSTLVISMSDNGSAFGEHGLMDKRTAYEQSIRVPSLALSGAFRRWKNGARLGFFKSRPRGAARGYTATL
ncbi:MAG: sulfatase-like hydrolase/transferase [Bryobacteraceae bacterium]|nr:sulfatase-like hydrolase/transferase [Bryobacteraceae bacterium]MDW8379969.1 sulfatase-like hydrolase/transferase [Bryobacterales bacterium]